MPNNSLLVNAPQNTNLLQTSKHSLVFPKMPFINYFVQTVVLPGVSTSEVNVPTPFSDTYRHGDKLVYDPLTVTCLVDEDIKVWQETYEWLRALTYPKNFGEYMKNKGLIDKDFPNRNLYTDGILTLNTNSHNANIVIKYINCHPTYLGMIPLSQVDNADVVPTIDITFRYDYFIIERIDNSLFI